MGFSFDLDEFENYTFSARAIIHGFVKAGAVFWQLVSGYARTPHDTKVIWYDMKIKLNMNVQEFSFSLCINYCFKSLRGIWPKVEVIDRT